MPIESVVNLVEILRQCRVLEAEQLAEVARLQAAMPDPRALARELIQRGWLTPYQVNQIFQGKGNELTLGQYIIRERLGEGGMGLVFKAKHRRMDRLVAIKVIRKEHVAHADALKRFLREMQAVASLSHPNIVMGYDGDQAGDTYFFAMEFVDGTDVGTLLKKNGALPIETACNYVRQAALGLQHAHEKGLVHRDIKPSNLLIAGSQESGVRSQESGVNRASTDPWPLIPDSCVKILDLGVARLHEPPGGLDSASALTKEGRVVGTPDFMAPEQAANSAKADIRSDIYSLGCTFYCMLAARLPFPGGTPMEKLLKHRVDTPTPIEQLRADVPPAVAAVLRKMMARNPEARFQTPAEVVQALDAIATGTFTVDADADTATVPEVAWSNDLPRAIPLVPSRRRGWLVVAGLMLGAACFGLAVAGTAYWALGPRKPPPTAGQSVDIKDKQLRELAARVADPKADAEAIHRDLLRYRQDHAGTPSVLEAGKLLMRLPSPLDELKPANIPAAERAPAFVPGERQPSFPAEVVAVLGQRGQRHWGPVRAVTVSPDGRWAASSGDDNVIRLWDASTMQEQAVGTANGSHFYWLGFLPDNRTLLSAGSDGILRYWRWSPPQLVELPGWKTNLSGARAAVAVSPDGRTVAVASPTRPSQPILVQLIDISALNRPGGKPQPHGSLPAPFRRGVQALAFNADGKLLAAAGDDSPSVPVWELSPSPRQRMALEDGKTAIRTLAFSREGSQLATGSDDGTVRVYDLAKPSPGSPRALPGERKFPTAALAFLPGGQKLAISDWTMRLWNLVIPASGREVVPFPGGNTIGATCLAAAGSAANPLLLSGSIDNTVRKWGLGQPVPTMTSMLGDPAGAATAVAFLNLDRTVADSRYGRPLLQLWEPVSGQMSSIPATNGNGCWVAATVNGRTLAVCGRSGIHAQLRIQGDRGSYTADDLPPLPAAATCLALGPDGKNLAVGQANGLIQIAHVAGAKPWKWRTLPGTGSIVRALTFSPDGKLLAAADEAQVRLLAVNDGKEVFSPIASLRTTALAFGPDSKSLAAGGGQPGAAELKIWDLAANQAKARPISWKRRHREPPTAVLFTPDGERLLSAGPDGRMILHNLASGEARVHAQLAGPIHGLALASGGRYAATANGNGTVYILRLIDPPAKR